MTGLLGAGALTTPLGRRPGEFVKSIVWLKRRSAIRILCRTLSTSHQGQQRSERVDRLRKLVELWRAAGEMETAKEQLTHLGHVAATFDILLKRNVVGRAAPVSIAIGEAFKKRVSAPRSWQPRSASSVPQRLGAPDAPDSIAIERAGGEAPSAEGQVAGTLLGQRGKKRPA